MKSPFSSVVTVTGSPTGAPVGSCSCTVTSVVAGKSEPFTVVLSPAGTRSGSATIEGALVTTSGACADTSSAVEPTTA